MGKSKYIPGFDLLKFFMALVVVNIHCRVNAYVNCDVLTTPWDCLNDIAVPSFFVLSSYFVFKKIRDLASEKDSINNSYRGGGLLRYELRLVRLYCFWIVVLSPAILLGWHKEYLNFTWLTPLLFIKNFFLTYQFGASWFFGALIVGVPLVYGLSRIFRDKWVWIIPFVVYSYIFYESDNKVLFDWYETNIRTPVLSFPAGLLWITLGHLLSNPKIEKIQDEMPMWLSASVALAGFYLGCAFHEWWFLFRIIPVVFIVFFARKIKFSHLVLCRRLRVYSIHLFCMHSSLIWVLSHIHIGIFENKIALYFIVLLICLLASEIIRRLKDTKSFAWLSWSM